MASRTNFHQFPSPFKDCPVQVIVGPQKNVYYVHPGVLSSCGSPVLEARVNDQWIKTGTTGTLDWTEFDEDTVECVLSYLYIEDYDGRGRASLGEQVEEGNNNDQIAAAAFMETPSACDESLGDIALMHAKVYCFAHQFLFSRLEKLALQRLTQLLLGCDTPSDPFFLRLADAIRVVYDSTPNSKPKDPARELLSQYVALKYTTISEKSLNPLIAEGGDFMIDVNCKLAQMIRAQDSAAQMTDNLLMVQMRKQIDLMEQMKQQTEQMRELQQRVARADAADVDDGIFGSPSVRCHSATDSYTTPIALRAVGELKVPWVDEHCLEDRYHSERFLRDTIGQVARYMLDQNVAYGVHSTYEESIFLPQVQVQGVWRVEYSPVINDNSISTGLAAKQCFWFEEAIYNVTKKPNLRIQVLLEHL
ncbi:hypothetical protein N7461_008054 [Penicillium sp. DV-2018c]|nr:hypothetical protein N7461_008054 [Penicillium sp. DV-2018c]